MDTIVSDEKDKVEENSHEKHALTMNGYQELLIYSVPTVQPFAESSISVSSDDVRETEIELQTRNPPVRNQQ